MTFLWVSWRGFRVARVMDPAYCDVIVQRYEAHTGVKAELVEHADQG